MSILKNLIRPAALAISLSGAFVSPASAEITEPCDTDYVDMDDVAWKLLHFYPEDWSVEAIATYSPDQIEAIRASIENKDYLDTVDETYDDLLNAVEDDKRINWGGVKRNASYVIWDELAKLEDEGDDLTPAKVRASREVSEGLMEDYLAQANDVLDAAKEDNKHVCLVAPEGLSPMGPR